MASSRIVSRLVGRQLFTLNKSLPAVQNASRHLHNRLTASNNSLTNCSSTSPLKNVAAPQLRRRLNGAERTTSARRPYCTGADEGDEVVFEVEDGDDFKERVLEAEGPVVVDFFATWCGPCKMLMPRLQAAVESKSGAVRMAKVDIDEVGEVALDYGVQSVPTVMAFSGGQRIDTFVGVQSDQHIHQFIDQLVERHGH